MPAREWFPSHLCLHISNRKSCKLTLTTHEASPLLCPLSSAPPQNKYFGTDFIILPPEEIHYNHHMSESTGLNRNLWQQMPSTISSILNTAQFGLPINSHNLSPKRLPSCLLTLYVIQFIFSSIIQIQPPIDSTDVYMLTPHIKLVSGHTNQASFGESKNSL